MSTQRFELQGWECLNLLKSKNVGRACIIDHGYPLALPVNYLVVGSEHESQVVVRTTPDTLIGLYDGLASFEVDDVDVEAREAWSVIVRGKLHHVSGAHGLPDPGPWLDGQHHWMVLEATTLSGRRFAGKPSEDGYSVDWELRPV